MSLTELSPPRRVVTGHTPGGKSVVVSDHTFEPFYPGPTHDLAFSLVWHTDSSPAKVQGSWEEFHGKAVPYENTTGTILRIADCLPGASTPMHRTISLDYAVVLAGEITLEMDDGIEVLLRSGDVVVQRGTIHAWHNKSKDVVRLLFVLIASEGVVIDGKELEAR